MLLQAAQANEDLKVVLAVEGMGKVGAGVCVGWWCVCIVKGVLALVFILIFGGGGWRHPRRVHVTPRCGQPPLHPCELHPHPT